MAFTRAQATQLLNKSEMRLFDDSRANALRKLDRTALAGRVERTRESRDRARDLLRRQRQAARKRGEGKDESIAARTGRKEALLVEILQRFVDARKAAPVVKPATSSRATSMATKSAGTAAGKAAAGSAKKVTRKTATAGGGKAAGKVATGSGRKAVRKTAAAGGDKAAGKVATDSAQKAARKAATGSAAKPAPKTATTATKKATAGTGKPAPRKRARKVTPEAALDATRQLLEAKQERDRTPQAWQTLDPTTAHVPGPGYQSPEAASKAQELHAGEARMASIHGSMSARDRRNQGKRDHRDSDPE